MLLDFGIAMELARGADESDGAHHRHSPLRVARSRRREVPTPASDWYALGVMLYEALAGRPPFEGSSIDLLMGRPCQEVIAPSTWVRGIPPDLEALCVALLQREPSQRPEGAEILRRLGAGAPVRPAARLDRTPQAILPLLVGREDQLRSASQRARRRVLGAGRHRARQRQRRTWESPRWSSTSSTRWPRAARRWRSRGRAYERESVPYKARRQPRRLARASPGPSRGDRGALRPAQACRRARSPVPRSQARSELRPASRSSRSTIRSVFATRRSAPCASSWAPLAQRRPLVLYVDDVQWGDIDSAALLHEVMRPPEAPPILLVMTYRAEEASTSPFLTEMNERWPGAADLRDVAVGPLDQADVQLLALARMSGSPGEDAEQLARAVAREAKGSPFLVEELVRSNSARTAAADSTLALLTLAEVVGIDSHACPTQPVALRRSSR